VILTAIVGICTVEADGYQRKEFSVMSWIKCSEVTVKTKCNNN
jgi:hypothetical protein